MTKYSSKTKFTILAAASCILLLLLPTIMGKHDGGTLPNYLRFIGRFHPVILHLPIGMFTLVFLLEIYAFFTKKILDTKFIWLLTSISAVVAVIAGIFLYYGDPELAGSHGAEDHMWGGIGFAVWVIICATLRQYEKCKYLYLPASILAAITMTVASHEGGSLTHGENYLTEFAPEFLGGKKSNKTAAAENTDPVIYSDIIAPMMEEKCWKCHNAEKSKGKFRMDQYELLVKGGKETKGLIAGDAVKSNIIVRCELPLDDEDRMPPDEKPGLNTEQMTILKWWIQNGASPTQKLSEAKVTDEIKPLLAKNTGRKTSSNKNEKPENEKPAEVKSNIPTVDITELQKLFPGAIQAESQASPALVFSTVGLSADFNDDAAAKLAPALPAIVSLDLSGSKITDKTVANLAAAKNLRSLRLAETSITDAAPAALTSLPALESLNLYGTQITDASLAKLAEAKSLKHLYLWKTKTSPTAIEELKKKLPNCRIETGMD